MIVVIVASATIVAAIVARALASMGRRDPRLWLPVFRAKRKMKRLAKARGVPVGLFHFGATAIDPKYLSVWITTEKDYERDLLKDDPEFEIECRGQLLKCGYPATAVPLVGITMQSQQTVDKNSGGRWVNAIQ